MQVYESDTDTETRIARLTEGLNNEFRNKLQDLLKHSKENALNIFDYLQSFKNEINPSLSYQVTIIFQIPRQHKYKVLQRLCLI